MQKTVQKQLGLTSKSEYELFAIVPITNEQSFLQHVSPNSNTEIAVRLTDSNLSLRNIEDLLICKEKSQDMLKKNNEALLTYVEDLKNLRNIILSDIGAGGTGQTGSESLTGQAANKENILKKALKCKQLEDDNKKLRKLLKTQIENSE